MSYRVKTHPLIEKDLKELDHALIKQVFKKLKQLQTSPQLGKPLGNKNNMDLSGYYKVYVAKKQVRIVYSIENNELVVYVIAIGKRDDMEVYDKAAKRK